MKKVPTPCGITEALGKRRSLSLSHAHNSIRGQVALLDYILLLSVVLWVSVAVLNCDSDIVGLR